MVRCMFNGGIGICISSTIDFPTLCWPTTPLKVPVQHLMKLFDLKNSNENSGINIVLLNISSSVVPAPIPFGSSRRIIDFRFSKHGDILATAISPSAKMCES